MKAVARKICHILSFPKTSVSEWHFIILMRGRERNWNFIKLLFNQRLVNFAKENIHIAVNIGIKYCLHGMPYSISTTTSVGLDSVTTSVPCKTLTPKEAGTSWKEGWARLLFSEKIATKELVIEVVCAKDIPDFTVQGSKYASFLFSFLSMPVHKAAAHTRQDIVSVFLHFYSIFIPQNWEDPKIACPMRPIGADNHLWRRKGSADIL